MSFTRQITNIRLREFIPGTSIPINIQWTEQDMGEGENAGRFGPTINESRALGSLSSTDQFVQISNLSDPGVIRSIMGAALSREDRDVYRQYLLDNQ